MITPEFKSRLLDSIDIADIIGSFVDLKRRGSNFVGLCPFHNEKTPSFSVSSSKQFYYCFGCGAKGDVVQFLVEYSGLSFIDALKELCTRAGIMFPEGPQNENYKKKSQEVTDHKNNLKSCLLQAARFYKKQLSTNNLAILYLKNRAISGKTAANFHLGFSPDGWQNLEKVFEDYANSSDLLDAGLVTVSKNSRKRFDRFRKRIIFPIFSKDGEVIGLGGRLITTDKNTPKYLNSPETILFSKNVELYGLCHAQKSIGKLGRSIVVEGYFDVLSLHQAGFNETVATLGTAFSPNHLAKLEKLATQIIFMFGGDNAGKQAAWRSMLTALHHFKKQELMIKFAFLPKDQDPDSIVRERGAEAIEKILAEALPLSTWVLETICSPSSTSSVEERTVATKKFREIFKKMTPGIFKTQLTREVCNRLGCSTEEILGKNTQNVVRVKPVRKRPKTEITAEFQMLKVLIRNPAYLENIKMDDESWFLGEYSPILEFLKETLKNADTALGFDGVIAEFNKKKGDLMGTSIAAFEKASLKDPVLDDILSRGGELKAEFDFLLTTLKIKELEHLTSKLSAEPNIDGKKIKELRTEIVKLKNAQIK